MNQNKGRTKKLMVVFGLIAVLAVAGVAVFAFQPASTGGQITVSAPNYTAGNEAARISLRDRLGVANALLASTDRSNTAVTGSGRTHFAPIAAYDTFQNAVDAASRVYARAGVFSRGEEFDMIVNIAGNDNGFAAMLFSLDLPPQFELVGVTPGPLFEHASFNGGIGWNPDTGRFTTPHTGTGIVSGWGGRNENFMTSGDVKLLTYRIKVTDNAAFGATGQMAITFGSGLYPFLDRPVRVGSPNATLDMSINGTTINAATVGTKINLGTAFIVAS
jgi:hypothetical protein